MKKTANKPKASTPQAANLTPQADLLYQALETELGGVEIYTTALTCVQNDDLREEWAVSYTHLTLPTNREV